MILFILIEPIANIEDYTFESFLLENYHSHPAITAEMVA